MENVLHAKRDRDIVAANNLLLLFARARAWATLALVDLGPFELASEITQHCPLAAPGQWLRKSHFPLTDMD